MTVAWLVRKQITLNRDSKRQRLFRVMSCETPIPSRQIAKLAGLDVADTQATLADCAAKGSVRRVGVEGYILLPHTKVAE